VDVLAYVVLQFSHLVDPMAFLNVGMHPDRLYLGDDYFR